MEHDKVNVLYDESGRAIRVQMDFDLYRWLVERLPQADRACVPAH